MITAYQLFDFTGYHEHSRSRWLRNNGFTNCSTAKNIQISDVTIAIKILEKNSKEWSEENNERFITFFVNNTVLQTNLFPISGTGYLDKQKEKYDNLITRSSLKGPTYIEGPKLDPKEPTIFNNSSFDPDWVKDLYAMFELLEKRVLTLENIISLPQRSFRNEIIETVNRIAKVQHKQQRTIYTEAYKQFDFVHGIKKSDQVIETTRLDWYDKHGHLPKMLYIIKQLYSV